MKAYQALGRFRAGASFRPWLLRIVANEAINRRKSAGRRPTVELTDAFDRPLDDPEMSFVLKPSVITGEQVLTVEHLTFGYAAGSVAPPEEPDFSTMASRLTLSARVDRFAQPSDAPGSLKSTRRLERSLGEKPSSVDTFQAPFV